jgi:hypothetical protein
MKIWKGYGSEHSAKLVMIGKFKDATSAKEAKEAIDEISKLMRQSDDGQEATDRYSEAALDLLQKLRFHSASPSELKQFVYDIQSKVEDDKVIVTTDEVDVSGFFKILIDRGARVEIYSRHEYPSSDK